MGFSARISNGLEVAKTSLKVLNAHKELIVFPILSGISIALVIGSFFGFMFGGFGWGAINPDRLNNTTVYLGMLVFYVVNYFIVVFFNMGLMHCARLYFNGEEVSVAKGLSFSVSRIHYIFLWALFAATVGTLLRFLQDNLGWLGKLLIGLVGVVWSAATFFVIPILAYENVGPSEALKRSANMMKQKWGEGISANFSLGLLGFGVIMVIAIVGMGISALVNEQAGIVIMVAGILMVVTIGSALHSILISAIYCNITGNLEQHLNNNLMDQLFIEK